MSPENLEKPPIGLIPYSIWKDKRFNDVSAAIARYYNFNLPIPPEWIEEFNVLVLKKI